MTIELTVQPEVEVQIQKLARERGISIEDYVGHALAEKLLSEPCDPARQKSIEEFLDAIAYHGPMNPAMKTQEITREFIYGDHP